MSKDKIISMHTLIYYSSRVAYTIPITEDLHESVIKLQDRENCFRTEVDKLHGQGDRGITVNCTDIVDAIVAKRIIDLSIISEINFIGESIYNHSYTNSFRFPLFTSNPEVHSFSKHGKHIAIIKSLGAYSEIDFSCWQYVTNEVIQKIFKNNLKLTECSNEISSAMSQISGLFLCEVSRNSSSLITLPMCLEIYDDFCKNNENRAMILNLDHNYYYKNLNDKLETSKKLLEEAKELESESMSEEASAENKQIVKYNKDIAQTQKEISQLRKLVQDLQDENQDETLVLKFIINNYFPMGMKGAVEASRETNTQINTMLPEHLNQSYDVQKEGSKLFQKILNNLEISLITLWSKIKGFVQKDEMEGLASKDIYNASQMECKKIFNEWYNIEFDENDWKELTMEVIGKMEDVLSIEQ